MNRMVLITFFASFALAPVLAYQESAERFSLSDHPVPFPPYRLAARLFGLQGETKLELRFEEGKVRELRVLRQEMFTEKDLEPEMQKVLIAKHMEPIYSVMEKWTAMVSSPFTQQVLLKLVLDEAVPPGEVRYSVRYGELGVISFMEIRARPKPEAR